MAGTTVTANLGGWGGSGDDSAVEQLVKLLNELVDDLETFRAAMETANGAAVTIANLTARRIAQIDAILQSITPATPDTDPASITKTAGDAQSGAVGAALSTVPGVTVKNAAATALAGIVVEWATNDGGILQGSQSITDASGIATMPWSLGPTMGSQSMTATVQGYPAITATFTATGTADAAAVIAAVSATSQSAATSGVVAAPPSVSIRDQYDNPVAGTTVTFAVTAGAGSRTPATVDSDANGIATLTSWTLGASAGLNTLTATAAGLTGSPVTFNANGVAAAPTQIAVQSGGTQTGVTAGAAATATVFRVKDVSNNAVEGVTVTCTVTSGNGTLGAATAVTNASGDASFTYTTHTTVETATITGAFNNASGVEVAVSTTIASAAGAATKLVIATQPASNGSSGTALPGQPIIHVTDANSNVVTGNTASIAAAIGTGNATISAGTPKAAVAGVATFTALTLVDTDSGSNTVVFSTAGLTSATSTGITLAPPVPVALQFVTQPSNVTEDIGALTCAVWVVDSSNIVVPGATNAITVALTTPGGATLSGTLTVNASSGTANFTGLAVDTPGTYTLTATSTGLTSAVSTSFTVSTASAGGFFPNKPSNLTTLLGERTWASATESGWSNGSGGQGTLKTDFTDAPYSPNIGSRYSRAIGAAGGSMGSTGRNITDVTEIYLTAWMRLSSTFDGHLTRTNKLGPWIGVGGGLQIFFNGYAKDNETIAAEIYFQGLVPNLGGNDASGHRRARSTTGLSQIPLVRGEWFQVEIYAKINTFDQADGILRLYIDGVQCVEWTNAAYIGTGSGTPSTASTKFSDIKWNPIWGGGGDSVTTTTYIDVDHFIAYGP